MTLPQLPPDAAPEPGEDRDPADGLTDAERNALAQAAATGQQAANWILTLAARQADPGNRNILERYAAAVEQALSREIIPGSEGQLTEELRHTLDAYALRGSNLATRRPELTAAERVAMLAIGFTALTAPLVVINDLAGDLALLCEAIDQALAIATAAQLTTPQGRP